MKTEREREQRSGNAVKVENIYQKHLRTYVGID